MGVGLLAGKFYPPHEGHGHVINRGLAECDAFVVLVIEQPMEIIPGSTRAAWIQECHPQATVLVVDDILDDGNSESWAKHTRKTLGFSPDVVYSSEDYGAAYARYLGATHVMVDRERSAVPISATKIREDPYNHWQYLSAPVRAYLAKRVVVCGAESTGTTTLARALAEYFETPWVPEYGRLYSEGRMATTVIEPWRTDEFVHIAEQQNRIEDALARSANRILICDTDSFVTCIWHERYVGYASPEVDAVTQGRIVDMYLVTGDDIPFVQDGLRDGEHIRRWMHERFIEALKPRGCDFAVVAGSEGERLEEAVRLCKEVLSQTPVWYRSKLDHTE